MKITLNITGLGHVPSFKNSKMIIPGRNGKRSMLITKPERQKWMEAAVESFESQLRCLYRTIEGGTQMAHSQHCLTALLKQSPMFDDNVKQVPQIEIRCEKVVAGSEGAIITIERIK